MHIIGYKRFKERVQLNRFEAEFFSNQNNFALKPTKRKKICEWIKLFWLPAFVAWFDVDNLSFFLDIETTEEKEPKSYISRKYVLALVMVYFVVNEKVCKNHFTVLLKYAVLYLTPNYTSTAITNVHTLLCYIWYNQNYEGFTLLLIIWLCICIHWTWKLFKKRLKSRFLDRKTNPPFKNEMK